MRTLKWIIFIEKCCLIVLKLCFSGQQDYIDRKKDVKVKSEIFLFRRQESEMQTSNISQVKYLKKAKQECYKSMLWNKFWSLSVWLICRVYGSTTFDNFDLKNRKKFKIFVTLNYAGCHTHVGRGGNFSSQWSRTGSFKIVQIVKLLQVKHNLTFFAHISIKSAGAWKVRHRHLNVTKYNKSFSCKRFI